MVCNQASITKGDNLGLWFLWYYDGKGVTVVMVIIQKSNNNFTRNFIVQVKTVSVKETKAMQQKSRAWVRQGVLVQTYQMWYGCTS